MKSYEEPQEQNGQKRRKKKEKRRSKTANIIINCILVLALLCFAGSAGYLIKYYYTSYSAQKAISDVAQMIQIENAGETVVETDAKGEEVVIDAKYLDLYEKNHDFIGWIEVADTSLSYPVMYTPDDGEYYLHMNFDKEYDYSGLPFVDARCNVKDASENIIIYGHNMKSKTMFSTLEKYKDKSYLEEHPVITFDTIYGSAQYEIAYVILPTSNSGVYDFIDAEDEEAFDNYIKELEVLKVYDTGVSLTREDKLITLSTCEYSQDNGRMVVIAKKITE